jgi:hypothetical protein
VNERRERGERMREGERGETPPQAYECCIVPSFLNLIYHIITPRKKKTSIS